MLCLLQITLERSTPAAAMFKFPWIKGSINKHMNIVREIITLVIRGEI